MLLFNARVARCFNARVARCLTLRCVALFNARVALFNARVAALGWWGGGGALRFGQNLGVCGVV